MTAPAPPATRLHRARFRWVYWVIGVALLVVVGWRFRRAQADKPIQVQSVRVQKKPVRDFVTSVAAGRVAGKQEATIRAEVAAKVRVVHRTRGDKVRAGEPLISYDADELKERLRLAQAAVSIAQAQIKQAEEAAALAQANLKRAERLGEMGAVPQADVENLGGQSHIQQRGVETARATLSQAHANVDLARTALGKAVVQAPFSGTVIDVKVEVGESTMPGALIAQLADASALHVDAEIDESDLGRVKVGMPADVSFDAFPGERIRGKLTQIAPSVARDQRGGRSVAIDVELPIDPRLLIGMSADVDIIVAVREAALAVPPNAVLGRGAARAVYVVSGGVAKKRAIEIGIATWEAVEVTKGLAENDEVVSTLAAQRLADGVRVLTTPQAPPR